jgi:capsular exopolysaccharide synthesis family protein
LRDYIRVLQRRRYAVVLAVATVIISALFASLLQAKVYEGRTRLLLQPKAAESLFNPNTGSRIDPARAVETEIEIVESEPVQIEVRRRLGTAPGVDATPIGQTDVIEIRARSTNPQRAAAIANAYADAYVDFKRRSAVASLLAAAKEIQAQVTELQQEADAIDARLAAAGTERQGEALRAQRATVLGQQALFEQQLSHLQVEASLRSGGAQVVTPARAPTSPILPATSRNLVLATLVGLMLGVAVAFILEQLDDTIKGKEDIERLFPELPVIAMIPALAAWRDPETPMVISMSEPSSSAAEAYRTLRTSIQFTALGRPMRTLQVTSASEREGKTTTIANLAVAIANAGQRVIVTCCDLRRPRVHEFFGLDNQIGLTTALLGDRPLLDCLQDAPGLDRVKLLASGPRPPNPSELLAGAGTAAAFNELQSNADIVILDSPPVLPVTDAAILAGVVDATLLVVKAGGTTRRQLKRVVELLEHVEAQLIGVVLNGASAEDAYTYGYGYGYAPTNTAPDGPRRRRSRAA